MEEKERYEWNSRFDEAIKDNQTGNIVNAVEVLNKQDKRIKELEQENQQLKQKLDESETQLKEEIEEKNGVKRALSACNHQNDEFADMIQKLVNKEEELKQQLHDLPKKE